MNDTAADLSSVNTDAVYDQLVERLVGRLNHDETVLVIGSGLTTPVDGCPGVPSTGGLVDLLHEAVRENRRSSGPQSDFLAAVRTADNKYLAAFSFAGAQRKGNLGQAALGAVVRRAVLETYRGERSQLDRLIEGDAAACREAEGRCGDWRLRPGLQALGRILVDSPNNRFGAVLTSNFDPLIEIAVQKEGGYPVTLIADSDYALGRVLARSCFVVHFHGYWFGSVLRNTRIALKQTRQVLKASLMALMENKTVCVAGYGGWDDIFMEALRDLLTLSPHKIEVIWCFREAEEPRVRAALGVDAASERFLAFENCDADVLFPRLETALKSDTVLPGATYRARYEASLETIAQLRSRLSVLEARLGEATAAQERIARGLGKGITRTEDDDGA